MKLYEKLGMSTDDVLETIMKIVDCDDCVAHGTAECGNGCSFAKAKILNKEIKTKPRIATINTAEEFEDAKNAYNEACGGYCENCKYKRGRLANCWSNYLAEEIEVEE